MLNPPSANAIFLTLLDSYCRTLVVVGRKESLYISLIVQLPIHRTPDLFPKGDISGKFGSLVAPAQQLNLPELPMYGQFSMLGLTIREVHTNVSLFSYVYLSFTHYVYYPP